MSATTAAGKCMSSMLPAAALRWQSGGAGCAARNGAMRRRGAALRTAARAAMPMLDADVDVMGDDDDECMRVRAGAMNGRQI